jgi:hypothetical protein
VYIAALQKRAAKAQSLIAAVNCGKAGRGVRIECHFRHNVSGIWRPPCVTVVGATGGGRINKSGDEERSLALYRPILNQRILIIIYNKTLFRNLGGIGTFVTGFGNEAEAL